MRDIFLSYASEDRDRARRLVETVEASGFTVWWDRRLAVGKNYEEAIQEQLETSRCVVVLWSQSSVKSRWVKAEAQDAAEKERLYPVFLDRVKAPLEYRYLNGVDLTEWDGSTTDPEFARLLEALCSEAPRPSGPDATSTTAASGEARARRGATPTAAGRVDPAAGQESASGSSHKPGEVTAIRRVANELTEILDRVARQRPDSLPGPPSPDNQPGDVTRARVISRKLAAALASFTGTRGRVLPSALALRYMAWTIAVPTALLLALHGVAYLVGSGS